MRFAKLAPLLVIAALLYAPAGSATSLSPNATFYVPLPIPISLTSDWADTAAVAVEPRREPRLRHRREGQRGLGALLRRCVVHLNATGNRISAVGPLFTDPYALAVGPDRSVYAIDAGPRGAGPPNPAGLAAGDARDVLGDRLDLRAC